MIDRPASSIQRKIMTVMGGHYDCKTNLSNIEIVASLLEDNEIDYILSYDYHKDNTLNTLNKFLPKYLKNKIEDIILK